MRRNSNIDLLKTISILLVIIIHAVPHHLQMMMGRPFILQHAVPVFMVLFGYNRMNSIKRRGLEETAELYKAKYLWRQMKTVLIPYAVLWFFIELPFFRFARHVSILELFESFIIGGRGPGGYFVVLMIQAILLFPLLYHLLERYHPGVMLVVIFIGNKVLEIASAGMHPDLYRLLIIRHIIAIALGIYLAKREEKISIIRWVPLAIISLIYIASVDYGGVHFTIEHMWDSQHPTAYFWTFMLVYGGLNLPFKEVSIITLIGKSSYHIFLVQKIYFMFRNQLFENIPFGVDTIISIVISVTLGIAFYYVSKNNYFMDNKRNLKVSLEKYKNQ